MSRLQKWNDNCTYLWLGKKTFLFANVGGNRLNVFPFPLQLGDNGAFGRR